MPITIRELKTHEEKVAFLQAEQRRLSAKAKLEEGEVEEWCCSDCQWKILNDGSNGCLKCECQCHGQTKDWEEHEATLNKEKVIHLTLKSRQFTFKGNKLSLKGYPNLKFFYACGLDLEEVELDCPNLEDLHLTNNQLTEIDLSKTPNLVNLFINKNQIEKVIGLSKVTNLEDFRCNHNLIEELDVRNLPNLWNLDCSINNLEKLLLEGLNNLAVLDADMNLLESLDFPHLPELLMLSVRGNNYWSNIDDDYNYIGKKDKTLKLRSPKLRFLDFYISDVGKDKVDYVLPLENPNRLRICSDKSYANPDGTYNPDVATVWEELFNKLYSKREAKRKGLTPPPPPTVEEEKESKKTPPITDPTTLKTDYPEFNEKNKDKKYLDISHEKLTRTLIVDGLTDLKELNVGDNYLSYLVIRNCPSLRILRYAHNKLKHDAFIDWESCRNLKEENIDKENYDGKIIIDYDLEKLFQEDKLGGKENFNAKLKYSLTEEQKLHNEIAHLLIKAQRALEKKDLPKLAEIIEEIQELISKVKDDQLKARIQKQINEFKSALVVNNSEPNQNYWSLIIGSIFAISTIPIITYLIINKWVKYNFQKQINNLQKKKKQ